MWYASEKETLKENWNQYVGGGGLVAFAAGNRFCFCFCNAACFHPAGFSSIVCGWASIL